MSTNTTTTTSTTDFYAGRRVLVTGATGFIGKTLLEKLLRSCPGLDAVYVVAREKRGRDARGRVEDLLDGEIFERLNETCPKFRQKVVGIKGDVSLEGLGISPADRKVLTEQVSVIFHVAATVRFDEPLDAAVAVNVQATKEVIDLARECRHLASVVHVSTAFSHCPRDSVEERFYDSPCDPQRLIDEARRAPKERLEEVTRRLLGVWPNTYTFTKAVAEEVVRLNGPGLPICVYRPAIVTAALREPIPGWIDNINGPSGLVAGVACGLLRVNRGDANCVAEMVPVDLVVNSMIAIACKNAGKIAVEVPVYNYVSSPQNPVKWQDFISHCLKYGEQVPSEKSVWCYTFFVIKNPYLYFLTTLLLHFLPALIADTASILTGKKPQFLKVYKKVNKFVGVLAFFALRQWRFTNDNTRMVWSELSEKDKIEFPFDVAALDWEDYFKNQVSGIRKYVLKEDPSSLPQARKKYYRLKMLHRALQVFLLVLAFNFLYFLLRRFF